MPKVPLYSCASADRFPDVHAAVRKLAAAQWSQKVRFRETVLKMHDDGVRLFVEVGPSANLTAFVNDILIDREHVALATNVRRKGGVEQLLSVLGKLWLAGRPPALERLFAGRAIPVIDFAAAPMRPHGVALDNTMPAIRLDDADRELLRGLLPAASAPAPAVDAAGSQPAAPHAAVPADAAAEDGAREQVMAEYFDLMRGFLAQQQEIVESCAGAAEAPLAGPVAAHDAEVWPSSHAHAGPTPLLDEILEEGGGRLRARCRVSLINDRFIRDHVMSGPVSEVDPTLFGLSCVPFTVSLEVMAEACVRLAGRRDLRVIEQVKAFDWITLDHDELDFEVQAELLDAATGRCAARVLTARGVALSAEFGFDGAFVLPPACPIWPSGASPASTGLTCTPPACSTARSSRACSGSMPGITTASTCSSAAAASTASSPRANAPTWCSTRCCWTRWGRSWPAGWCSTSAPSSTPSPRPSSAWNCTRTARPTAKASCCACASVRSTDGPPTSMRHAPGSSTASTATAGC